jgi:chemotaxis regulatin CheY-phosphate phosphatase CheZ
VRQFKDKSAGTWTIDLNFGAVLRVKAATSGRFNLIDPGAKLADELAQDEGTFWELLWHVIEPQAAERQIDAAKFGELMAANCLHDARRLLFEEWTDFFRQLHRPDKAAVVEKAAQYLAKAMELAAAKLTGTDMALLDQRVEERMQASLNESFGKLLASLEPTPALSPGDSSTN